ncbi:hypothetical protein [Novosphingobium resinovorum]|uniref:hypothetical protein n=1 Tax=Novosphingobium resinovorum TaxID=158500 RepID=UPI0012EADE9B|nr:hypothetical protein [Novosphingobium resinovorum]
MRIAEAIAILPALALAGCVTTTPKVIVDEGARDAICKLSADIQWTPFGNVQWAEDINERNRLNSMVDRSQFSALPSTIICPDGVRHLHKSRNRVPFGEFWIAKDHSHAAITGGFIGGELLGGGGTCYYQRIDNKWVREGCVNEWSI